PCRRRRSLPDAEGLGQGEQVELVEAADGARRGHGHADGQERDDQEGRMERKVQAERPVVPPDRQRDAEPDEDGLPEDREQVAGRGGGRAEGGGGGGGGGRGGGGPRGGGAGGGGGGGPPPAGGGGRAPAAAAPPPPPRGRGGGGGRRARPGKSPPPAPRRASG